ncbi:MAG: thiamine-binding protein [Anaerolineae bacterium]|nr:thiamine-binding protein [Anaerolineae bacterium]
MDDRRIVTGAVQVLPLHADAYPVVDKAIAAIAATGVRYLVGPMETALEGTLDEVLAAAKAAHLACFEAGAEKVVTIIKIGDAVGGSTIDDKLEKYR